MRIAMMTNNYKPVIGGVPIAIERLAEGLRERGHEVYIFAPEYEGYEKEEKYVIRYRAFRKKAGGYVPLMKPIDLQMERKFRELKFDLIHVHHPVMIGQRAQYLGRKYGVPVVFTYHTKYEQYLHYWKPYRIIKERGSRMDRQITAFIENKLVLGAIRRFSEKCSLVFAPTYQIQEILRERKWDINATVMPTGIPDVFFAPSISGNEDLSMSSQELRRRYGGGKKYILCTVSRLSAEKNLKFLLRAAEVLRKKMDGQFKLLIIGDGPQKQELEEYAKVLGICENVSFLGEISNEKIAAFHCASDLFLFSSQSETQGIVLLEAMAGKSPVIAVEATGTCDVVRNGENGFLVSSSEEAFAQKAFHVLKDPKLFDTLSQGAYDTAERCRNQAVAWIAECNYERVVLEHRNAGRHRMTTAG